MWKKIAVLLVMIGVIVGLVALSPLSAHEEREIGTYSVELGWRVEPAYTTIFNGPEIFVFDENEQAVEGLEETLQLEVTFGPASKTLELRPVWQDPGHYTADLIPTEPGDYSFHLTGTIGDTDVDEVFTSADGKFGSVEPISDIQFP
jgi:hypothetical protein